MNSSALSPTNLAGLGVALWVAAVVAVVFFAFNRSARLLTLGAIGGVAFQVVHFVEHGFQVLFWALKPTTAWLSPWASESANGLTYWCSLTLGTGASDTTLGIELLHLAGNTIFFFGLVAFVGHAQQAAKPLGTDLYRAYVVQALHVAEHILLVGTYLMAGKALGVSTGFGVLSGTTGVAVRVWFHFTINGVATFYAVRAVREHFGAPSTTDVVEVGPDATRELVGV